MNTQTAEMKGTIEYMLGAWQTEFKKEGQSITIMIYISLDQCRLIKAVDGKEAEINIFDGNAQWLDSWLCFNSSPQYYVRHADQEQMIFGEYKGHVIGSYMWEYRFKRIAQL